MGTSEGANQLWLHIQRVMIDVVKGSWKWEAKVKQKVSRPLGENQA